MKPFSLKFFQLKNLFLPLIIVNIFLGLGYGQKQIVASDYERAVLYLPTNYNKKVFNLHIQPNWFPDSSGVWYIHQSVANKKYKKISFPDMTSSDLFDQEKLAQILSDSLGKKIQANDLPITRIEYKNPKELVIFIENKSYLVNTQKHTLSPAPKSERPSQEERVSPDKKWTAFSKDYNLYIKSNETNDIKQLSTNGTKGLEYASWYGWDDIIVGENGERPKRFGANWSDNSEWISTSICDLRTANKMYLLDWSIDTMYRPKLLSYYRGSPGDTGMVYMEPVFFNVNTGKEVKIGLPKATHINNISVHWSQKPGVVYLYSMSRGFQNVYLHTFDLNTENLQKLYTESSNTNIDNFDYEFAEKSNLLIFLSEKSGWRQLYSMDLHTKKEKRITVGDFYINSIERIDEKDRVIYFLASGKEKGRNPYYQHLYSVSFDGSDLKLLTPEDRHHLVNFSPDGKYFVDNYSTVNIPTISAIRKTLNGEILEVIGHADVSALQNWNAPEIFTALARDGKTTLYGAIYKPTNFDPTQRYPVLESSYTGPHTQVFPKDFTRALSLQSFAELGFVVVLIDGLGSSGRSKEFHNYSYKNLGANLEDHVSAIKQIGRKYAWVDTTRVGIFGHSAGGYDAGHALLAFPDFYKVGVASSADHDHRMEKAWWPEMYMGWPVDSVYHQQSNITMAGNLKGKLLLTHGGIDENVNPSATFKLAEALIKADKPFDMLILPSQRHGYQGDHSKYFTKVRWNYFVKHLLGAEPIWDFKWE